MTERVNAMLRLQSTVDGSITITVISPFENAWFSVADAVLLLTLWAESPDIIRGRFEHRGSGAVAYFQSSDSSLRRLAEIIQLVGPLSN